MNLNREQWLLIVESLHHSIQTAQESFEQSPDKVWMNEYIRLQTSRRKALAEMIALHKL